MGPLGRQSNHSEHRYWFQWFEATFEPLLANSEWNPTTRLVNWRGRSNKGYKGRRVKDRQGPSQRHDSSHRQEAAVRRESLAQGQALGQVSSHSLSVGSRQKEASIFFTDRTQIIVITMEILA